jgi:NADH:ubiquinone oxidoreductase subunit E
MQYQSVKVCKGPNCKAWSSDQVAKELREIGNTLDLHCIKVCRVPCMDACHGGVSVRVEGKRNIVKLKHAEEVLGTLGINQTVAFV